SSDRGVSKTTVNEVRMVLQCDRVLVQRCMCDGGTTVIVESRHGHCQSTLGWRIGNPPVFALRDPEGSIVDLTLFDVWPEQLCRSFEVKTKLVMPVWVNERYFENAPSKTVLWGFMVAHHCRQERQWQPTDTELLEQIAKQLAIGIQQIQLYQTLKSANRELQLLASLDGLTQVANRRHFDSILEREWRRCTRGQHPLSLILCDVDFFKLYNDCYGHLAGDECLQKVAATLTRVVTRASDVVARYGGEEFAIVLPETDAEAAFFLAESICDRIVGLQIPHRRSSVSPVVTLSAGVATQIPRPRSHPVSLLATADLALYDAKSKGRNCARSSQTLTHETG
ncbi:sensor domain-containing diguanylate cyclase, partial [Baaleninema sp.]|uniref:sensor domain-containing diguanylate cyclase n=1 Tax=Baaleninema sp. TaxID=3101197 RepID=UPI003CFDA7B0